MEYSAPDEIAVCNLASIALNRFVENREFDFKKLREITHVVTRNLNRIIDINYYPLPEARRSNMRHRPIGIGVQGLADTFILMRYPFESEEARKLNIQIFETIYYAALEASCDMAREEGPYETYAGSPVSKGILQYDMWNVTPTNMWDWATLKVSWFAFHDHSPPSSTSQGILGECQFLFLDCCIDISFIPIRSVSILSSNNINSKSANWKLFSIFVVNNNTPYTSA